MSAGEWENGGKKLENRRIKSCGPLEFAEGRGQKQTSVVTDEPDKRR